ncbi:hypothetical protein MRX96_057471 [Rhipicephalus microplus]
MRPLRGCMLQRRGFRVLYYGPEAGISAKGSPLNHDSVSVEHSTAVTPSSNEQGSSSVAENAVGRCPAVTTPETHIVVWTRSELAGALWRAAGLTTKDREDIIFRLRPLQNLAIISIPQFHVADALYRAQELRLGERVYPITTYFADPDNSCKGIDPGVVPGTSSSMPVDQLVAPATQILQAPMMGQTNIALVTLEELKVPCYVHFYRAELHCYPPSPPTSGLQDFSKAGPSG